VASGAAGRAHCREASVHPLQVRAALGGAELAAARAEPAWAGRSAALCGHLARIFGGEEGYAPAPAGAAMGGEVSFICIPVIYNSFISPLF
jgi:hypothetical protein